MCTNRKKTEKRFHELAVKEALGTITPDEHRKLERYAALRRSRLPSEPREALVAAYRSRLLCKYLAAIMMGRAGLSVWVDFNRVKHGGWPAR